MVFLPPPSAPGSHITFKGAVSAQPINGHTLSQTLFSVTHGTTRPSLWTLLRVYLLCLGEAPNPCACTQQCRQTRLLNVRWLLTALHTAQPEQTARTSCTPEGAGLLRERHHLRSLQNRGLWLTACTLLPTDPSATESPLWCSTQLSRPAHQPAWPSLHRTNPLSPSPSHTYVPALHPTLRRDGVPSL